MSNSLKNPSSTSQPEHRRCFGFIKTRNAKGVRGFSRDKTGVTAVEFAMVAPPFIALLMAVFEVGMVFLADSTLNNAVADAARLIRTGQQTVVATKAAFKTAICNNLSMFECANLVIDVETFQNFNSVNLDTPLNGQGELQDNFPYNIGVGGDVILVRVFYEWELLAPSITLMSNMGTGNRLMASVHVFRNEPF